MHFRAVCAQQLHTTLTHQRLACFARVRISCTKNAAFKVHVAESARAAVVSAAILSFFSSVLLFSIKVSNIS